MSEIIDIVTRLTYELQSKGLQEAATMLGAQIRQLSELQAQEKKLRDQRASGAGLDVNAQQALSNAILKNKKQQEELTQSINKSVASNRQMINSLNAEQQTLSKIENKIKDLKALRADASKNAISGINNEIKALEAQHAAMLQSGTGGSFLSGILGGKSLPTQLGQGLLYGLGIGSGFGIITRLTDALVGQLGEAGSAILNTAAHQDELRQKTESLSSAILGEVNALVQLNQQLADIRNPENVNQLQRELELIKAIGVVNGETFKAKQDQYAKEKQINEQAVTDAARNVNDILKVQGALKAALSSIRTGSPNEPINTQVQTGGGPLGGGQTTQVTTDEGNFARIRQAFAKSGANKETLDKILADIRKAGVSNLYSPDLTNALNRALRNIGLEVVKANESLANASNKVTADEVKFTSEQLEAQYELYRNLSIRLRGLQTSNSEQYIKDQEQTFRVTEDSIKKRNDVARNEEIAKVNDEIELSRKAGTLTAENEERYGAIKSAINKKYNEQILQQTREYRFNQIKSEKEQNLNEVQLQLSASKNQLSIEQQTGQDTFATRQQIAQQETKLELEKVNKKYDELFKTAYKNGIDTTQLIEEFQQELELVQLNGQRRDISHIEQYYEDRLRVLKQANSLEESELTGNANAQLQTYIDLYENGKINLRKFTREKKDIEYQAFLDRQQQIKKEIAQELELAKAKLAVLYLNPTSSVQDIKNAQLLVNNLQNSLDKVNQEISTTAGAPSAGEKFLFGDTAYIKSKEERRRAEINKTIDAYKSLTHAVADGAKQIIDIQNEQLDREISIREKRIDVALKLAERGNTEALRIEEQRLNEALKQREINAKKQQEINAALALSDSIVAVAKAASESGAGAIVIVPAVIAAIIAGYAAITAATKNSTELSSFAEGVENFNGKGTGTSDSNVVRISRGESVLTAKATQMYSGIPTMMNKGVFPKFADVAMRSDAASKIDLDKTNKKLDGVIEAIGGLQFKAENKLDGYGVTQTIQTNMKLDRRRFS